MATQLPVPKLSLEKGQFIAVLNSFEEERVLRKLKKTALENCTGLVKEFSECAAGRALSIPFACYSENKLMQRCVGKYTTDEHRDVLRKVMLDEKRDRIIKF